MNWFDECVVELNLTTHEKARATGKGTYSHFFVGVEVECRQIYEEECIDFVRKRAKEILEKQLKGNTNIWLRHKPYEGLEKTFEGNLLVRAAARGCSWESS